MTDDGGDWSAVERRGLEELAAGVFPSPGLETGVMERLRRRGHLRPPLLRRWMGPAVAAAAAFALGLAIGRGGDGGAPSPRYALLLYGGEAPGPALEAERVREYGAWAGRLGRARRLAAAEKLGVPVAVLGGDIPPEAIPRGYFLLAVDSPEAARALALECPHLRHGGQVVVQPIDPT